MTYENLSGKSSNALGVLMAMIMAAASGYILLHLNEVNYGLGLDPTFKLVVELMLSVSVFFDDCFCT